MGEIRHQHTAAVGRCYQVISDLTQYINERNETWPQHRELYALLFATSVWVILRPTGLCEP